MQRPSERFDTSAGERPRRRSVRGQAAAIFHGVEAYLESPLPRLSEAGWRIVWFFTISTTHLVFNSFSVEDKNKEFYKGMKQKSLSVTGFRSRRCCERLWKITSTALENQQAASFHHSAGENI